MAAWVWNIQITCPGGDEESYGRNAGPLAALYGALLGMEPQNIGYQKLRKGAAVVPEIGFEGDNGKGDPPPRWPDPDHPQQMHLDIEVGDLAGAEAAALELGATRLAAFDDHVVLADHAGHPFCLYPAHDMSAALPGRLVRIVIDCFSPRALAGFYEQLLGMHRVVDTPDRVEIATNLKHLTATNDAGEKTMLSVEPVALAFQHGLFPAPRWPDPAYPEQLHLDLGFADAKAGLATMERLGARCLASTEWHSVWADPAGHPFCAPALGARSGVAY